MYTNAGFFAEAGVHSQLAVTLKKRPKTVQPMGSTSFRSKKNFVTAIYFHCGGLDLMPSTH